MSDSPLMTLNEARERLQFPTIQEVQKLIDGGLLQSVGSGIAVRVKPDSVEKYLAEHDHHDLVKSELPPVIKKPEKIAVPMLPISPDEMSEDGRRKKQEFVDRRLLAIFEQETYEAETARDEALKKREKPAELEKREKAIAAREQDLMKREQSFGEREAQLNKRTSDLGLREKGIEAKQSEAEGQLLAKRAEADKYYSEKKAEADRILEAQKAEGAKIVSGKTFELETLKAEYSNAEAELKKLEAKLEDAQGKLRDIRNQVENYTHQTAVHRDQHYRQARASSGSNQAYHDAQANEGWNLEKMLNSFMRYLNV